MGIKYSIITINLNNVDGLGKTLKSIKSQAVDSFEYIIVDGASSDGSVELICANKSIISTYISEPDSGIYNAMNKGISVASGEYILFINSGDELSGPDVMKNLSALELESDIVICKENLKKNETIIKENHTVSSDVTLFNLFLFGIPHQACLVRRSLLLEYPFDENYRINSDFKFFLQTIILEDKSVQYLDYTISNYDCDGISSTNSEIQFMERKKIYEELIPRRIRMDYDKVFPNYYEVTRVGWLLKHPFFYRIYRMWTTLGRKILRDK